jgi:hypothetical protein
MIKLSLSGRLGNQLFQVAFAYILAKNVSQKIIVRVNPKSKFGFWLNGLSTPILLNFLPSKFLLKIHLLLFKIIKEDYSLNEESCLVRVGVPTKPFKHILLDGYFQDGSLLTSYKKELVQIFSIKSSLQNKFFKKYSELLKGPILVVNLRLREYSQNYFEEIQNTPYIDPNWYYSILEKLKLSDYTSKIVISDDIEHAKLFLSNIDNNFLFIDDDWYIDFQFLLNGDTLIIPNSSFSWWGAFLNQKERKKVFAPKNWVGNNANIEYPTGIMIDEFEWV